MVLYSDSRMEQMYADSDEHQRVHEGYVFITTVYFTGLSDGSVKYILIDVTGVPSNSTAIVESVDTSLSSEAVVHIYSGPDISANGTLETTARANFLSTKVNAVKVYSDPTINSNGTEVHTVYTPGVSSGGGWSGTTVSGSFTSLFAERMLDRDIKMLIGIENVSGATMDYGTFIFRHREEPEVY